MRSTFDTPQEFFKLRMSNSGGGKNAKTVFPPFKVSGSLGGNFREQIHSPGRPILSCSSQYSQKLAQPIQGEWTRGIFQEWRDKGVGAENSGVRATAGTEGTGDCVAQKFFRPQELRTEDKVELVENDWKDHGLNITLKAIELPKSTWYYHQKEKVEYSQKYRDLRSKLEQIIVDHPDYGVSRIKTELEQRYHRRVNHKVLRRLLKMWELGLSRAVRSSSPGPVRQVIRSATGELNLVADLDEDEIRIFEVLYTDFTELRYSEGDKRAWLIPVIGHQCKLILGWALGHRATLSTALKAWNRTRMTFRKYHVGLKGKILHQDQDSVFTSNPWIDEILRKDRVRLSYSENGAKGNVWIESFNGHFKCPNQSLFFEAKSLSELEEVVRERVAYWNHKRRHTSLKNRTPIEYIKENFENKNLTNLY